ncbi:Fatty acid amide hydrolase [Tetrabaena socialis]|uniref:Fatty acid amide hydrolase n=1 Tax=Tetrabaena socialis TaxID=47790 RepID=A0A2J8A7I4_9CHLO|nr:Fatty acid amide hydrolase [Tetrabaena socialis]|eukprot:PNH08478.1 Fatty acid amide hydrolase [Tetrabaena socialis]
MALGLVSFTPPSAGATTPTEVAERITAFVHAGAQRKPPTGWFVGWQPELVRKQAEESTNRIRSGTARSILEGVPYAIKDVADALPYSTAAGTTFIAASFLPSSVMVISPRQCPKTSTTW